MNKPTSIYLDLVRFTAAVTVFFGHVSGSRLTGGLFWQMGPYGPEAVDVFFVLSGFVIAYVYDTREHSLTDYAVSRFARIYSVAIPALIVTFILDAIGRTTSPGLYSESWHYVWHGRISQILHAVTFTNQIWFNNLPPGSDFPFWSLGFEVWYYVIFGVAMFTAKSWRIPAVLSVLLIMGPKVAAMFPIWLMGVAAYHLCKRIEFSVRLGATLCLGAIAAWIAYEVYVRHSGRPIGPNWIGRPPIIQDYIIGTLFTIHLIGFRTISHIPGPLLLRLAGPIRWIAGATLTLYLFHLPLAQFIAAESPWSSHTWQTRTMVYLGVPVLVFIIAHFTERRKDIWRHGFQTLFSHFQRPVAL